MIGATQRQVKSSDRTNSRLNSGAEGGTRRDAGRDARDTKYCVQIGARPHVLGLALALSPPDDLKPVELIAGGALMERFWSRVFAHFAQPERQRSDDDFALDVPDAQGDAEIEMTSHEVRSRRFRRQLFGGLRPDEVTTFLDQVAEALQSAQRHHIEVEAQLRLLESDVRALGIKQAPVVPPEHDDQEDDAPAASRLQVLRSTALQEVEALLHDAQARAQALTDAAHERAAAILRETDALKSRREEEAEQLVAEATLTVESILTAARDQEASLRNELDRLAESRLRMLDDLWATLNGCQEWLASIDPRRRGPEEPEGRLDRVA